MVNISNQMLISYSSVSRIIQWFETDQKFTKDKFRYKPVDFFIWGCSRGFNKTILKSILNDSIEKRFKIIYSNQKE